MRYWHYELVTCKRKFSGFSPLMTHEPYERFHLQLS